MARDLLAAALMAAFRLSRANVLVLAVMLAGIGLAVFRPHELFLYNPSESLPKGFYIRLARACSSVALVGLRT